MIQRQEIEKQYSRILQEFLTPASEKALLEVSDLGKSLVLERIGPDLLIDVHSQCLQKSIEGKDPFVMSRMVINATELLLNGIMAYAMNYYSYMDLLDRQKIELQESHHRIEAEKTKLDDIVSAIDADRLLLDPDLKILWVNRRLRERQPHHGEDTLIGKRCNLVYCNLKTAPDNCPAIIAFKTGKPVRQKHPITHPDGTTRYYYFTCSPIRDPEGTVVHVLELVQDVTEQHEVEEMLKKKTTQLETQNRALEHANDRLQDIDRLKSTFLATMSHELRTPLNSIIGFTGIMLQELPGPLNAEQRKQLGMVQGSSRHLLDLINDVLDISKIEAGQLEILPKRFDLRDALAKVMASVGPLARQKDLALESKVSPKVNFIISDPRRVEQILINLLNNAIKFTETGSICMESTVSGDKIVIHVTDTGVGIRPEDLGQLFKPFQQINTGINRQHEGSGLGLSICIKLAHALGGTLSVESKWGVGSTFTLTIPKKNGGKQP